MLARSVMLHTKGTRDERKSIINNRVQLSLDTVILYSVIKRKREVIHKKSCDV